MFQCEIEPFHVEEAQENNKIEWHSCYNVKKLNNLKAARALLSN